MNSIFLLLDMMNDLIHADGPSAKNYGPELTRRRVIDNTAKALAKARAANIKIGYVRVGFSPDYRECPPTSPIFQGAKKAGMFKLGTWGTEVHPALAPAPGEFDIVKHRVSPFYATSLEALLRTHRIERLYLCGVSTTGAVLSAAKEGHDRDYELFIVDDCCCALNEEQHRAAIDGVRRFARIVTADEVTFAE